MANAIDRIMAQLSEAFAPLDAQVLADTLTWAQGRAAALAEFNNSEEAKALRGDTWKLYNRRFAICGGKTWHAAICAGGLERFVTKHCELTAKARNARIAAKLVKAGIAEVLGSDMTFCKDGFNGRFHISTGAGRKTVKVETIIAGGYNIQCRHLRVLVSIR